MWLTCRNQSFVQDFYVAPAQSKKDHYHSLVAKRKHNTVAKIQHGDCQIAKLKVSKPQSANQCATSPRLASRWSELNLLEIRVAEFISLYQGSKLSDFEMHYFWKVNWLLENVNWLCTHFIIVFLLGRGTPSRRTSTTSSPSSRWTCTSSLREWPTSISWLCSSCRYFWKRDQPPVFWLM